jgi:hypothetical protein
VVSAIRRIEDEADITFQDGKREGILRMNFIAAELDLGAVVADEDIDDLSVVLARIFNDAPDKASKIYLQHRAMSALRLAKIISEGLFQGVQFEIVDLNDSHGFSSRINGLLLFDILSGLFEKKNPEGHQEAARMIPFLLSRFLQFDIDKINQIFALSDSVCEVENLSMKLVGLVAIIEFVLTRNPDFSRFNVEDSINKQFQLKTFVLAERVTASGKTFGSIDFAAVNSSLKNLYNIRSKIAHGDAVSSEEVGKYYIIAKRFAGLVLFGFLEHYEFCKYLKAS